MKTLYIIRHGKSFWDDPSLSDHDRPLMQKGIKRTLKIASFFNQKNIKPDLMISSSAKRALNTAQIIAEVIDYPLSDILVEKSFYHTDRELLTDYLYGLENNINSVMVFGHNPTFTSFANQFLDNPIDWLPTTGTVSVSFKTDKWENIMLAKRTTDFVMYPKML